MPIVYQGAPPTRTACARRSGLAALSRSHTHKITRTSPRRQSPQRRADVMPLYEFKVTKLVYR
eukprot:5149311-Pleurochrysis_carterae.AAC.3